MNTEITPPKDLAPFTKSEVMIDSKAASFLLKLPFFWFKDPSQRTKHRIPHYHFYKLVRFKPSEIMRWAKERGQPSKVCQSALDHEGQHHA